MEDVEINLLPINSLQDLPKKSKYQKLFTHAYFANSMVHHLTQQKDGVSKIMADDSFLIIESAL